jgi:hypothetical protein
MGAWGTGTFDNDDANDWLIQLRSAEDDGFELLAETFDAVPSDPGAFLEATEASQALAAAEILAAAAGKATKAGLPDDAVRWLKTYADTPNAALVAKARAAIKRVRDESELRDLWADSDELDAWLKVVDDLVKRLPK